MDKNAITEDIVSKEDLLELIDSTGRYIRLKSLIVRVIISSFILLSITYFVGFGNKSVLQHVLAIISLILAYFLGKNDFYESTQIMSIDKLKRIVTLSKRITFKLEAFDLQTFSEFTEDDAFFSRVEGEDSVK